MPAPNRPHVVLLPEWYPSEGSPVAGTFVRDQARAIAAFADVTVIHYDPYGRPAGRLTSISESTDGGIRVLRLALRWQAAGPVTSILRVIATRKALKGLARQRRIDVIHAHVFTAGAVALIASVWRAPVVLSEHYTGVQQGTLSKWQERLARFAYRHASLVTPVGNELAGAVADLAPSARVHIVPNAIDTDTFSPPPDTAVRGPSIRVITVALLTPKKAIGNLLEAMVAVTQAHPEAALDVVGDGPERDRLERRAKALGIEGRVTFHGLLEKGDVAKLMRAADVFVLPSDIETFGCVVIEALCCGLPVVATDVGGLAERISRDCGIIVPPGDPSALADATITVLDRHGLWASKDIAEQFRSRYGFEAAAREWRRIYDDVIDAAIGA